MKLLKKKDNFDIINKEMQNNFDSILKLAKGDINER